MRIDPSELVSTRIGVTRLTSHSPSADLYDPMRWHDRFTTSRHECDVGGCYSNGVGGVAPGLEAKDAGNEPEASDYHQRDGATIVDEGGRDEHP